MSLFVRVSRSQGPEARRNERESFNSRSGEGSEDRVDRDRARNAGVARRRGGDARGASFRNCQHENESDRESFRSEAVAAKRNRPRACRLQIVAGLAWRRCRVRSASARLLQEDFEDAATSGVSESAERTDQGGRRFENRQV